MHRYDADRIESRYFHFFDLREKIGAMLTDIMKLNITKEARIGYLGESFKGRKMFKGLRMEYNVSEWENKAINPRFKLNEFGVPVFKKSSASTLWYKFHIAAAAQRAYVKAKVKP